MSALAAPSRAGGADRRARPAALTSVPRSSLGAPRERRLRDPPRLRSRPRSNQRGFSMDLPKEVTMITQDRDCAFAERSSPAAGETKRRNYS
jgi:hypothetical protein